MKKKNFGFTLAEGATHIDLPPTNAKAGFTLAEVLITLGIIGIVAAMTLPTLITNANHKKNAAMLKEDFSILSQVMLMALDSGKLAALPNNANNMNNMKKWFNDALLPNLKTVNVCYDEPGCWLGTEKYLNGQKSDIKASKKGCGQATISFSLSNGSTICYDDFYGKDLYNKFGVKGHGNTNDFNTRNLVFYVDVNGSQKLPNVYGKDIFIFVFDAENDTMVPAGRDRSESDVTKDCSITGTGRFCAAAAKRNGWNPPKL